MLKPFLILALNKILVVIIRILHPYNKTTTIYLYLQNIKEKYAYKEAINDNFP
jgi:hypothetical protein